MIKIIKKQFIKNLLKNVRFTINLNDLIEIIILKLIKKSNTK